MQWGRLTAAVEIGAASPHVLDVTTTIPFRAQVKLFLIQEEADQ